jgi:hypothetical protein
VDGVAFASQSENIRFVYPPNWHPVKDDTILTLVPAGQNTIGRRHLVVDTPDLPLHIPGLIPLGLVVGGFEDDLKKRYKDVAIDPVTDTQVGGQAARQVTARGRDEIGDVVVVALLCVKGDRVYLVDAETALADADDAARAFATVVKSIQWMN